jgi:hypothetical protein
VGLRVYWSNDSSPKLGPPKTQEEPKKGLNLAKAEGLGKSN